MTIAIIGTGRMGRGLARRFAEAGEDVLLCGRDDLKAAAAAAALGPRIVSALIAAAADADIVVVAVPHHAAADAIRSAGDLAGKIVIDITNPIGPEMSLAVGPAMSAAEEMQKRLPKARVVKAFNTLFAELLDLKLTEFDTPPQVLHAGDDGAAKERVAGLIAAIGFEPLDAGPLRNARFLEPIALMTIQLGTALGHGRRIAPRFVTY